MENEEQGVEQNVEQASETEAPVVAPATEEAYSNEVPEELPSDPEKQKEAFIKMRQELKALKEKQVAPATQAVLEDTSLLDELEQNFSQPVTQDTNVDQVLQQVEFAKRAALESMKATQQMRIERENQQLFKEFPELDPQAEGWSQTLDNLVASRILLSRQMGKPITAIDAARQVKGEIESLTGKAKEEAKVETKEALSRKETATLEATGNAAQAVREKSSTSPEYLDQLRDRVRRGDTQAAVEYDKIIFGE